jgi:hypothetical protein
MNKSQTLFLFLIVISIGLLTPNFMDINLYDETTMIRDHYDRNSDSLQTTSDLQKCISNQFQNLNQSYDTLLFCETISTVIKQRFYHSFTHYRLNENWVAAVAGKLFWKNLSQKVIPDDILKSSNAACSQQGLVFLDILQKNGIEYCTVQWKGHFAVCAKINQKWHYFDPDLEPQILKNERLFDEKFNDTDFLCKLYGHRMSKSEIDELLGTPKLINQNIQPARNAILFHTVTCILSKTLWVFPWMILIYKIKPASLKLFKIHAWVPGKLYFSIWLRNSMAKTRTIFFNIEDNVRSSFK